MKKKRVLFFVEKLYGGGVEKIARIILRNFDYERYDVTLYTLRKEELGELSDLSCLRYGYVFDRLDDDDSSLSKAICKVRNKVKLLVYYHTPASVFASLFVRGRYDVAIAFIEGYATRIVSGLRTVIRKIAWIHIDLTSHHWTEVAYRSDSEEIEAYDKMDHTVCVSQRVLETARQLLGIRQNVSSVLYNPIEVDRIVESSLQPARSYFGDTESLKIISLGTLTERKGYVRLIRAFNRMVGDGVNAELLILGEGKQMAELKEVVDELGIKDRVHLPGFINNPYPYIRASDIYVCSSDAEGYNTAITESLILGKAIVATDCCGVREQLGDDNDFGIRVPISEQGIYEGLKSLVDTSVRQHYAKAALSSVERFNLYSNMESIYRIIES